ncbi:MAG: transcriptional repressor LexA [Candidatus Moranbacteria bacterium]|nr:transcriptional repressor LexA [Candidatus Moranbacteria bacterium]
MLTKRQKEILDFIKSYSKKKGYSPSFEEIRKQLKLASVSTVHFHISKLKEGGYLGKIENKARAISITQEQLLVQIPLLGSIAAGKPIEAIQEYETIAIPKNLLAKSGEHFALQVKGNSMIQEGIFDGDNIIIRKQNNAEDGDTIVALINQNEVTLKKIYKVRGGFKLQPANPSLQALVVKQLIVQGKVVSVMRSYVGRKALNQTLNLLTFNNELKQLIVKTQEEIRHKFKPNKEFEIWQRTENKPDQDKFCLETGYTFLNEILLLWVCKDKKLLSFEVIQNRQQLKSLKQEAQQIYSHIFANNIFDWYEPSDFLLQEITNSFNKYDFTPIDRDILGKLYEQFITQEERKKLGQFFLRFFKKLGLDLISALDYNRRNH